MRQAFQSDFYFRPEGYFYPRTPGGVRPPRRAREGNTQIFLSTHPGRGATFMSFALIPASSYFYPRTPGGVRPAATARARLSSLYFYPRTPGGVRLPAPPDEPAPDIFLSTHPGRGATRVCIPAAKSTWTFLSTHPGRGATAIDCPQELPTPYFYPRTPGGVRRGGCFSGIANLYISIHAPRAGCDCEPMSWGPVGEVFLSTHPGRGATLAVVVVHALDELFLSTHPGRGAT